MRFNQQITRYKADPEVCNSCVLKAKCTEGKSGRALARPFDEHYYDRVRAYRGTFPYELDFSHFRVEKVGYARHRSVEKR